MGPGVRRARLTVVVTGLALLAGGTACDNPFGPGELREGPAAAWTLRVATGGHTVAVQGDVVVVTDERALLGLDLASGEQRWRRDVSGEYRVTTAAGLLVRQVDEGPLEVLDPATGATRWRDDRPGWSYVVRQEAVYAHDCLAPGRTAGAGCTVEARELADGRIRWTAPAGSGGVRDDRIGSRHPIAPTSGPYLVVDTGRAAGVLDTRTGRPAKGRLNTDGWSAFTAGDVLVSTDHDPPAGDQRCTVTVTSVVAATGAAGWSGEMFSPRRSDGECQTLLSIRQDTPALIGTGSRVATATKGGRPQVVDLANGRTVWAADRAGAPIDGDGRSLLVRQSADTGPLTLFDFDSGRVRWEAPDPGLSGDSASWSSAVSGGLVAVSGAEGDRPFVVVHDATTGKRLGQFPSWLAGLGDDWVAVTRSDGRDSLALEFVRF